MTIQTIDTSTVTCHECHKPLPQREAQPIQVLVPTSQIRNGRRVLAFGELLYECVPCFEKVVREDPDPGPDPDDDPEGDCWSFHQCSGSQYGYCILRKGHEGQHYCGKCASYFD